MSPVLQELLDLGYDSYNKLRLTLMMIGVLLTVISKSKDEDEMGERIRIMSIAYGFVFLIFASIISIWLFENVDISLIILICVIPFFIINLILQKVNSTVSNKGNIKFAIGVLALIVTVLIAMYFNAKI